MLDMEPALMFNINNLPFGASVWSIKLRRSREVMREVVFIFRELQQMGRCPGRPEGGGSELGERGQEHPQRP